jgi:hypothetical protein
MAVNFSVGDMEAAKQQKKQKETKKQENDKRC